MATSNVASSYVSADATSVRIAKAHRLQVWNPSMPVSQELSSAINTYTNDVFTITSSGSIGIGTTIPSSPLHVSGIVRAATFQGNGSLLTNIATSGASSSSSSNIWISTNVIDSFGSNVGIGTQSPLAKLHIAGDGTSNILRFYNILDQSTPFIIDSLGNVGFGTANPTSSFDVFYNRTTKEGILNSNVLYPQSAVKSGTNNPITTAFYGFPDTNGIYTASASTYANGPGFNYTGTTSWNCAVTKYNATTGLYGGGITTEGYQGEWIQLVFPDPGIVVKSYDIKVGSTTRGDPKDWRLFGSMNGETWFVIDERTNQTFSGPSITNNYTIPNNTSTYNHYRLVINKITPISSSTYCSVLNMNFYGYAGTYRAMYVNDTSFLIPITRSYVGIGTSSMENALYGYYGSVTPTHSTILDCTGRILAKSFRFPLGSTRSLHNTLMNFAFNNTRLDINLGNPGSATRGMRVSNLGAKEVTIGGISLGGSNPTGSSSMQTTGNVGIGTFPGLSRARLHVQGRSILAGNVGIGTTNIDTRLRYILQLSQDSAAKPASSSWSTTSDPRLKENIVTADYDLCENVVRNLDLKYYKWRDDIEVIKDIRDRHKLGWIAQEVQEIFPKAVSVIDELYGLSNVLDLNVDQIYAAMYGAIKKLIYRFESMRARFYAAYPHMKPAAT